MSILNLDPFTNQTGKTLPSPTVPNHVPWPTLTSNQSGASQLDLKKFKGLALCFKRLAHSTSNMSVCNRCPLSVREPEGGLDANPFIQSTKQEYRATADFYFNVCCLSTFVTGILVFHRNQGGTVILHFVSSRALGFYCQTPGLLPICTPLSIHIQCVLELIQTP
jgi:hypothetical protein